MARKTTRKSSNTAGKRPIRGRSAKTPKKAAKKAAKKVAKKVAKKGSKKASRNASTKPPAKPRQEGASGKKRARRTAPKPAAAKSQPRAPTPTPGLSQGAPAPTFRLTRDGGATVALGDFAGRKLVVFFYPRANTPGCTREAIDFTRLKEDFARAGAAVVGVSADSVKAQESFRDKHALAVPLLSDGARDMLVAYGAWGTKSNYGKSYEGIIRTTVLIDAGGRVAQVWRNVRVDGHADEVLAAARAL